jgi:protein SCO1/2
MNTKTARSASPRRWLLATAVVLVLAGAAVGAWAWWHAVTGEPLEVYGSVPDFSLVERGGRTVTRADLLGKVSVVDFFYTRCPDTCPLQSAHLARLQAELSDASDLLLVSITVDPDHDSRAVLSSYARSFHANPTRWLFLTGPHEAIYHLAVDGFHLAAVASVKPQRAPGHAWIGPALAFAHEGAAGPGGDEPVKIIQLIHGSRFALVDRRAQIRGYFDGTNWDDVKRLEDQLKRLLGRRGT